jgi:hypothetical protein
MAQYEFAESSGVVESVERKTTSQGREFGEITISGVQYTSWEEMLTKQAEMMKEAGCTVNLKARAKVMDNGKVSQFWQVTEMVPQNGGATHTAPKLPKLPAMPVERVLAEADLPVRNMGDEPLRLECLNLAIRALVAHEEVKDINVVTTYAEGLEAFVRGTLPKETK